MDFLHFIKKYIYYLSFAYDEYHIHSPFVFDFYLNTIKKRTFHTEFKIIEKVRQSMLKSQNKIKITDYGSGTLGNNMPIRSINHIAKYSLKPRKFGELLFQLSHYYQPKIAVELGTSLGVTSLYQALPLDKSSTFYTFEGCPEISKIARKNLSLIKKNIQIIEGNIDSTLPGFLSGIKTVDYVFFDANHRKSPTLRYFEYFLEKSHENSIFIFDDIYRSREMEMAWNSIKNYKEVSLTIDLFHMGIVLFRQNQPKQHFMLKF